MAYIDPSWSFGTSAYHRGCQFEMMIEADRIAAFEAETGLDFDPQGPSVWLCQYCDGLGQFMNHHECAGTQGAALEAAYGGHGLVEE